MCLISTSQTLARKILVQIVLAYHDIPLVSWENCTPHLKDHPSKQSEETADALLPLVICRNANIHIAHR